MHSDYNTTEFLVNVNYIIGPSPFTNEQGKHFLRVRQGSCGKMGQGMERP